MSKLSLRWQRPLLGLGEKREGAESIQNGNVRRLHTVLGLRPLKRALQGWHSGPWMGMMRLVLWVLKNSKLDLTMLLEWVPRPGRGGLAGEKRKQEADKKQQVPSPSSALSLPPLPLSAEPNMNHLAKQNVVCRIPILDHKAGYRGRRLGLRDINFTNGTVRSKLKNVSKMLSTGPAHSWV